MTEVEVVDDAEVFRVARMVSTFSNFLTPNWKYPCPSFSVIEEPSSNLVFSSQLSEIAQLVA